MRNNRWGSSWGIGTVHPSSFIIRPFKDRLDALRGGKDKLWSVTSRSRVGYAGQRQRQTGPVMICLMLNCPVFLPPHTVQGTQGEQDVDEGVLVGDGLAVAQPGALDAEFLGLGVDALGGGALLVDVLVDVAVAVDQVADARADAGGHGGDAALGPFLVLGRTGSAGWLREEQRASVAAAFVFDAGSATDVGVLEGHSQPGLAQWPAPVIKLALFPAPIGERNGGEGLVEG